MGIYIKEAGEWQEIGPANPPSVKQKMIGSGGTTSFVFINDVLHALHVFKANSSFICTAAGSVEYVVVGGGGNGGAWAGGGGGGVLTGTKALTPQTYNIVIGAPGADTTFAGLTGGGGGGGGGGTGRATNGSGGGGAYLDGAGGGTAGGGAGSGAGKAGGVGGQGADYGGNGAGGGGGGAGGVGGNFGYRGGGAGGVGLESLITGTALIFGRGGDGACPNEAGQGLRSPEANSGGGGSGRATGGAAGVVIIRYPVE